MDEINARIDELAAKVETLTARMNSLSPSIPLRSLLSQIRADDPTPPRLFSFGPADKAFAGFSTPSSTNQGGAPPKPFSSFLNPSAPPRPSSFGLADKGFGFSTPSSANQGGAYPLPNLFSFFSNASASPRSGSADKGSVATSQINTSLISESACHRLRPPEDGGISSKNPDTFGEHGLFGHPLLCVTEKGSIELDNILLDLNHIVVVAEMLRTIQSKVIVGL
ncbi:hypothetical protein K438DRAFT_1749448 [Mycena galopus ATCC 62051]|nr:hypothetical protein K438DRAFT_1749448 [Mycena galopus ATCC 62051]